MRLLNLETLELRECTQLDRPRYVILSHTWEAEEVSLEQSYQPNVAAKAGYIKILNFCREGAKNGFDWGCVDTFCIRKTSSAELSEAINSMYKGYKESDSCYAILSHVSSPEADRWQFSESPWYRRGWTLQALIAPKHLMFYFRNWTMYETKDKLWEEMSKVPVSPR